MDDTTKQQPRPNYYLLMPTGAVVPIHISNLKIAKQVIMDMNETVRLIKIKRR